MRIRMKNLSGEELLLAAVFGGAPIRRRVNAELDRRALLGSQADSRPRRSTPRIEGTRDGLLVA